MVEVQLCPGSQMFSRSDCPDLSPMAFSLRTGTYTNYSEAHCGGIKNIWPGEEEIMQVWH